MSGEEHGSGQSMGPATDRKNDPVIDPTKNVYALVEAETTRQDDLRAAETRRIEQQLECIREVATLRALHARELREAEAARIDAIRAVDVGAVNRAAEVAATQAATLAQQVSESAETLRKQVTDAASASATALAAALDPIQKDIADLRRVQYESVGQKTQVVETQAQGSNLQMWVSVAVAALVLLVLLFQVSRGASTVPTPTVTVTTPTGGTP